MPTLPLVEAFATPVKVIAEEEILQKSLRKTVSAGAVGSAFFAISLQPTAVMAGERISNDLGYCEGRNDAVLAVISGIKASQGKMRIQSYRATKAEWLRKGRWLKRIEVSAKAPVMRFCIPVGGSGNYAIAVRHDINGNGKTDITKDGGGMSNNPSITIWNLGKPSYKKVSVAVTGLRQIHIVMKYM